MAYDPTIYNPWLYANQMQHGSGIVSINQISDAVNYPVPINSSSPPLFLANEDKFLIKIVDANNNVTIKHYKFEDITPDPMANYVTKDDLDMFMKEIKEAINGKHVAAEPIAEAVQS